MTNLQRIWFALGITVLGVVMTPAVIMMVHVWQTGAQ